MTGHVRRIRVTLSLLAAAIVAALMATGCQPVTGGALPPGVGASWSSRLAGHQQVVVAIGDSATGTGMTLSAYDRVAGGWKLAASWRGFNGRSGWGTNPPSGTGHSPIGVFSLTTGGGYAPNPGTRLPYEYRPAYYSRILNGVRTFNHVIAIDFNHVPGSLPSDSRRTISPTVEAGIWIHTSHESPSSGCMGVPDAAVTYLLRWLDPKAAPVIVMGPKDVLAR
jgi:L,D-peptidoglycan transpeptidase YkuD (ErfK/YbiS/YcfS/YnhG family)